MSAPVQRSFSAGELSPSLYARTDLVKYATGLRQCRNMIVQRHGGVTYRPGTVYLADAKSGAVQCLLVPFIRDTTVIADTFVIEVGDSYARFYQNGAPVTIAAPAAWVNATVYNVGDLVADGGSNYYCKVAHTAAAGTNRPSVDAGGPAVWYKLTGSIYEIPMPYTTADLSSIRYVQSGDVISLVHPSYPPRELKRYGATKWILTTTVFGPSLAAPSVTPSGGGAGTTTWWAVTAVKQGSLEESLAGVASLVNLIPTVGNPVVLTWGAIAGAIAYKIYRSTDGKTYGLIQSASGGQAVVRTDTTWTTTLSVATSSTPGAYLAATTQCRDPLEAITAALRAFDGTYTVKFTTTLVSHATTTGLTRGRVGLYYLRNTDSSRIFYGYLTLDPVGGGGQSSGAVAQVATIVVPDNGYSTLQIDLVPEVQPGLGSTGNCTCTADSSTAPNNAVSWNENSSTFSDNGSATPDYKQAPPTQQALFLSAGNYPAAVGRYQQRLLLGGTQNDPERTYGSRTGIYNSFAISTPLVAADSISWIVGGNRVNVVKHILDIGRLVVFGADAVTTVDGDNSGAISPSTLNTREAMNQGIGSLRPLKVDDSAIYVQARGTIIRDLKPRRANPSAMGAFDGTDLTLFANHLFDGFTIVDWAYQQTPHSVIWAVRSDGALLALTYLREHEMAAWHRHDTDGFVENVCVVPEGAEDALYLVVRRVINGVTRRMVERMSNRFWSDIRLAIFMDCALTYNGWSTSTTTMTLTGGVLWDNTEVLTLTASANVFAANDVLTNMYFLLGADGLLVRLSVQAYTSPTSVTVKADRVVPASCRAIAIGNGSTFVLGQSGYLGQWAKALLTVTGASQLERRNVSVFADGFVVGSPNNPKYPLRTVINGAVTLDQAAAIITVGLPYLGDIETLDLDGGQNTTIKDSRMIVPRVGLYVQNSRGIWIGRSDKPTTADPTFGLNEWRPRQFEPYDSPPALTTDYKEEITDSTWSHHGRMFVRQVDPVPLTVLSITALGLPG